MELNPYASFLGSQDARAVLAATPGLLHQAVARLTPEQAASPIGFKPDGTPRWSPREIVAHLADCELVFSVRLRQTLAPVAGEPDAVIQPFDQDAWARTYSAYDLPAGLELFRSARGWNLKLVGSLGGADFTRRVTHPERGTMTFQTILETMAGHDLNHLGQLQRLAPTPEPQGEAGQAVITS